MQETIWDWLDDINAEGGTGFAGYNDWRLPNVKELQGIVNYGNLLPVSSVFHENCEAACTMPACSCTAAANYWSSTSSALAPDNAWLVFFGSGLVFSGDKNSPQRVRAVRGGQ